jgi:hypothetical protein
MCRAPLRLDGARWAIVHPLIRPGETLVSRDFTAAPLPGEKFRAFSRADGFAAASPPEGIVVTAPAPGRWLFIEPWLRVRDACVRATITALEGTILFGLMARMEPMEGGARTYYALDVDSARRAFRFARCFSTKNDLGATPFVEYAPGTACVAPPGHANEIEIRAQGTALEAWVNGARVAALYEAALGIGFAGIRIDARGPARAFCRGFEIRQVAS